MLSANTFTRCACLVFAGFLSACGSGGDSPSPNTAQETAETESPLNDDQTAGSSEETGASVVVESSPVESNTDETGESLTPEAADDSSEGSPELANPQNANPLNDEDSANTDSQLEPTDSQSEGNNSDQVVVDHQPVSFDNAKLLVDLVPNGGSYPGHFYRTGDKLYFWTVDTDPHLVTCGSHWLSTLTEEEMNIEFNFVATHPETGVVTMNKKMMTVGDFAEFPRSACPDYNSTIMHNYKQTWLTPDSTAGEQQFVVHHDSRQLGPVRVWATDGSETNTRLLESGEALEETIFVGDKIFFIDAYELSVSNSISGDRRKLFESNRVFYDGDVQQIMKSPERLATFQIKVGDNRFQIWTYDLDTDEWAKEFTIKPDDNSYSYRETLLADGDTLLSRGYDAVERKTALAISRTYGDVESFEIVSHNHSISDNDPLIDNNDPLFYSTNDTSVEPHVTSIWRYNEARVEKLFTIPDSGLFFNRVIAGQDGRIYATGTKELERASGEIDWVLELWSYDLHTEQVVKLSDDDWYAVLFDQPTVGTGYLFRYLNTPDGLVFVNLKEDSGREIWFTDGTPEGTRQLTDINPGPGNSDPQNFYYSEDAIYFSADDGTHGHEPWMITISR